MSDSARSPLSGCTILILAVLMLTFLIGFSIWTPFRQAAEMEKFTRAEASPVPVTDLDADPSATEALQQKLNRFRDQMKDPEVKAELRLDADELNRAIALAPQLEELRRTFYVSEITAEALVIDISYRLNGRPRLAREDEGGLVTADPRYLVGTLRGEPLLTKRELVLRVNDLDVPEGEVAEGFMGHFSTLRLFEASLDDPEIGPVMAQLTDARLEASQLVLTRTPGAAIPDTVTDEVFQQTGGKIALFLGGAAVIFLLIAGSLLYLGYRKQLSKLEESEKTNATDPDA